MRRYNGNTGRYEYIEDRPQQRGTHRHGGESPSQSRRPQPQKHQHVPPKEPGTPTHGGQSGDLLGGLQNTLANLFRQGLENEDLLLFAVLFLMYQETKDKELLIIMGGMFLL